MVTPPRKNAIAKSADELQIWVPRKLWQEICEAFPMTGRRRKSDGTIRNILLVFIRRALRDRRKQFGFNQKLLDKMYRATVRKHLVKYLKRSRYFRFVKPQVKGLYCIVRQITVPGLYQPSKRSPTCTPESSRKRQHNTNGARWRCDGDVVIGLCGDWYADYGVRYRTGAKELWGNSVAYIGLLEQAQSMCVVSVLSRDDLFVMANEKIKDSPDSTETPEEMAARMDRVLRRYARNPLGDPHRVHGRAYYPLVGLPKALRRRCIRFAAADGTEPAAEVDLSSTYWVILTSMLQPSDCRRRLEADICDGSYYERIAAQAGQTFESRKKLKQAVQKQCMFGAERYGYQPLFVAMAELYPDLARLLRALRQSMGVTGLSHMLTTREGELMIDRILPTLVSHGIPALPVHDAVVVPLSQAQRVRDICSDIATEMFGFRPKFKITTEIIA